MCFRFFLLLTPLLILNYINAHPTKHSRGYFVSATDDRYGANATRWMSAILVASYQKAPLFHDCSKCIHGTNNFTDKVFHEIISDFSKKSCFQKKVVLKGSHFYIHNNQLTDLSQGWWVSFHRQCSQILGKNVATKVKESGLDSNWFSYFERKAQEREWKLRWDPPNALVIHVRLDDMAFWTNGNEQAYIGDERLRKLIEYLSYRFPDHDIHIVTSPKLEDIQRCQEIAEPFMAVKGVWGDKEEDYALWQMMCSDILILSRSTFSITAGLLHRGEKCFIYERSLLTDAIDGIGENALWEHLPRSATY